MTVQETEKGLTITVMRTRGDVAQRVQETWTITLPEAFKDVLTKFGDLLHRLGRS